MQPALADFHPRPKALVVVYGAMLALALVPVALTAILPLADLPNHLARTHILNELGHNALLQKYYSTDWHPLGFQSTDFMLPPLAKLVGVFAASRIYVAVTFALLLGGTAALHRALFGSVGLWPLVSVLFLYNYLLAWGFISYLFAIGLALLLFGAWIATTRRREPHRTIAFGVGALVLLLCHFFAFAAYAVLVSTYEVGRVWRAPAPQFRRKVLRLARAGAHLLIPALLVLLSLRRSAYTISYYGSLADVMRAVLSPTIMFMDWADLAITFAMLTVLWFLVRHRRLHLAAPMRLPLAVLLLLAVAMPAALSSVWGANLRIPCLLVFLLVAASKLELRRRREAVYFLAGLAVLTLIRVGFVTNAWQQYQADFAEFRSATTAIDRGSRVLNIPLREDGRRQAPASFPYTNVAALAVIERDVFLPQLFTLATPLAFREDRRDLTENVRSEARAPAWHPTDPAFASTDEDTIREVDAVGNFGFWNGPFLSTVDWSRWPEDYDYLIDFDFGRPNNPVPALLTEVRRGSYFTIYRIHPPGRG